MVETGQVDFKIVPCAHMAALEYVAKEITLHVDSLASKTSVVFLASTIPILAAETKSESSLSVIIGAISMLIWQAILIWFLLEHRAEIKNFFGRVTSLKIFGAEVGAPVQTQSADATEVLESPEAQALRDPQGFFTASGIAQLIKDYPPPGETPVSAPLLFFRTENQHTWLVATQERLFCVLDDSSTRETRQLVQWAEPIETIRRVSVQASDKPMYGFLHIEKHRYWYFSPELFSNDGNVLKKSVLELVATAKKKKSLAPPMERPI
jgi:hypothetical protein